MPSSFGGGKNNEEHQVKAMSSKFEHKHFAILKALSQHPIYFKSSIPTRGLYVALSLPQGKLPELSHKANASIVGRALFMDGNKFVPFDFKGMSQIFISGCVPNNARLTLRYRWQGPVERRRNGSAAQGSTSPISLRI